MGTRLGKVRRGLLGVTVPIFSHSSAGHAKHDATRSPERALFGNVSTLRLTFCLDLHTVNSVLNIWTAHVDEPIPH